MKKVFNHIKHILLEIWQLPQNIVGLLFLLFIQGEKRHKLNNINFYYSINFPGGITLGEFIIVGSKQELTIKHEYGHVLQSRILGPFYLLIIGLPSLLHAWLSDYIGCCDNNILGYYHFYTEKWANKLGKVII